MSIGFLKALATKFRNNRSSGKSSTKEECDDGAVQVGDSAVDADERTPLLAEGDSRSWNFLDSYAALNFQYRSESNLVETVTLPK